MAYQDDIALMAHLMRRAGFGAGRDELEARVAKGYEATVEELLHPEAQPPTLLAVASIAYMPSLQRERAGFVERLAAFLARPAPKRPYVIQFGMYHLVNTKRPLEEKMALF